MRILLVHNYYQIRAGEDIAMDRLKKLLESNAHEVRLYAKDNNEIKKYGFKDKLSFLFQVIFSLRAKADIMKVVKDFQPDIAIINNVFPLISPSAYHALYSLRVPILQRVPTFRAPLLCINGWFYTKNNICERCKRGNLSSAVRYRCYRESYILSFLYAASTYLGRLFRVRDKISLFICPTEFSKKKLIEAGILNDKICIMPYFINTSVVNSICDKGIYALFVGRLSQEKGLWTLIKAFERIGNITLKIIGVGPMEIALKNYVKSKSINNIEFLSAEYGERKVWLQRSSFCTIVPSEWYESFPLVILESYAAGTPVIASNLGALPYIVDDGKSGLLFKPGNIDDLIKKICYLRNNLQKAEKLGRYARNLVEQKYSPEKNYKTLLDIFQAISINSKRNKDA